MHTYTIAFQVSAAKKYEQPPKYLPSAHIPHKKVSREASKEMKAKDQERLQKSTPSRALTIEALEEHDRKTTTGPCDLRQFGCEECHMSWWRTVIKTKPVSRCKGWKCGHRRYDALPRFLEFGIGRCVCPNEDCGKEFFVHCEATDTFKCRKCKTECKPYVHPKWRKRRNLNPHAPSFPGTPRDRSRDRRNGRSNGRNDAEVAMPYPYPYPYPQHPSWDIESQISTLEISPPRPPASLAPSRQRKCPPKRKIFNASEIHEATGSTISTFLSQIDFEDTAEEVPLAYDSDDDDEKVGACKFECDCGNEYTVICRMVDTAPCYKCRRDNNNNPLHWEPPRDIQKKSDKPHRCSRCDGSGHCPNLEEPIDS